ncbi:hypothetical protein [Cecembia sp.]|uniref:hypothetical protein n=1 Tax=Cecembia sp. TaxID=1898110 RepID=UPI0025C1940E|nr:hypothetical protein [Cecembia sp.]
MLFKRFDSLTLFLICLCLVFLHSSCQDRLESQQIVYSNNFGQLDLRNFENGRLFIFQGDTLLGFYNNEEVSVTIPDLPGHNVLKIEVDLWIHDSWDGNPDDGVNGPDFWFMKIDEEEVLRTTFSNTPCMPTFCLRQSYPQDYFRQNDPKSGAVQTNLPGLCLFGAFQNYTTRYRISRMVSHNTGSVKITLGDELLQTNSPDPICDESWSVGKIEVTTMVVI